jgi:hypothetical protein
MEAKIFIKHSDIEVVAVRVLDLIGLITAFAFVLFAAGVFQHDYAAILLSYVLALTALYSVIMYGAGRKAIRDVPEILYFRAALYKKMGRRFSGIVVRS